MGKKVSFDDRAVIRQTNRLIEAPILPWDRKAFGHKPPLYGGTEISLSEPLPDDCGVGDTFDVYGKAVEVIGVNASRDVVVVVGSGS
jgi:hypothetical protein